MTAPNLAARVAALEDDRDRQLELLRHMAAALELLAQAAGARTPVEAEPSRVALRLIHGEAQ